MEYSVPGSASLVLVLDIWPVENTVYFRHAMPY